MFNHFQFVGCDFIDKNLKSNNKDYCSQASVYTDQENKTPTGDPPTGTSESKEYFNSLYLLAPFGYEDKVISNSNANLAAASRK